MSAREDATAALQRWERLEILQDHYSEFTPFLHDMMQELGFNASEIQEDIGAFLAGDDLYIMVQAQRGQAKTTITAIYAVWCLIHNPKLRVLIVSAGDRQATEISTLIVRLIQQVDELEMMRPDPANGDRTAVDAFDVHYSLKGLDKSPSIACFGINANIQGARADLLIADDIESLKNSQTAVQRAKLDLITKDFTSINSTGRIVWLGTPQSIDSIYNGLPGRGYVIRIWPGRYPSPAQLPHYGDQLAPIIRDRVLADPALATGWGLDGQQGAAVDPLILPEQALVKKELDQGAAFFQLQHMLLTAMTDAMRHPLKSTSLIAIRMMSNRVPLTVTPGFGETQKVSVHGQTYSVATAHEISQETVDIPTTVMYIDPAGGGVNGDETAWAFGGLVNSSIYVREIDGQPGGHDLDKLKALADHAVRMKPTIIKVEKNMGFGLFLTALRPIVTAAFEKAKLPLPAFDEDLVGPLQKEKRIISILEPVMGRGALVIAQSIIDNEAQSVARYDPRLRNTYSFLFQLNKLTRDKDSLIHDDRVDALAGLVAHFGAGLAVDQNKALLASQKKEHARLMKNPLGLPAYALPSAPKANAFTKRVRKL